MILLMSEKENPGTIVSVTVTNQSLSFLIIFMALSCLSTAKKVWILGDSYVKRSKIRARETLGTNLGVHAHIQWFGRGGMRWDSILHVFHDCLEGRTAPDMLLIHCGGNDLGLVKSVLLVKAMKKDLHYLHQQFPQMKIILSSINQRRQWRYGPPGKIDKARKFVNSVMDTFILDCNGRTVPHPDIVFDKPGLFLRDNVHLTPKGHDIFLCAIAKYLKDIVA